MQLPALNLSYTGAMEWLENHSFLVAMYVILSLLNVFFFFTSFYWKMINKAPSGMNFYLSIFGITQES